MEKLCLKSPSGLYRKPSSPLSASLDSSSDLGSEPGEARLAWSLEFFRFLEDRSEAVERRLPSISR